MEKHCEFCGQPIEGFSRSTKKYCSDNCKQLAFYARQGMTWGQHLSAIPFNVKPDFTLNGNTKGNSVILHPISSEDENIPQLEQEKESLSVKNFTVSKEQGRENTLTVKNFTVNEKSEVQPQGKETISVKLDSAKQEKYKWIHSPFLEAIECKCESYGAEDMFRNPRNYWNDEACVHVSWVTVRLRCLLENIIRLSNYKSIDRNTLLEISRAFGDVTDSFYFKYLPRNYPFYSLIIELRDKFDEMAKSLLGDEITLRLSSNRKAELIAMRFMIGNSVEKRNFSALKFSDGIKEEIAKKYGQDKNEDDENEDGDDD